MIWIEGGFFDKFDVSLICDNVCFWILYLLYIGGSVADEIPYPGLRRHFIQFWDTFMVYVRPAAIDPQVGKIQFLSI
jgi:hypothetical protein